MPFCIQMFLIFILPKISSQGVMDAFWVTIEWLVISTMFDQVSHLSLLYSCTRAPRGYNPPEETLQRHCKLTLAPR